MEWLGVPLMLGVAILAAGACKGMLRLLYVVAPIKAQDGSARQGYDGD